MADAYFEKLHLITMRIKNYRIKAWIYESIDGVKSSRNTNFPHANSTLRVTYGQVKGYSPADAVYYEPITHLEGVMKNTFREIMNSMFRKTYRFVQTAKITDPIQMKRDEFP